MAGSVLMRDTFLFPLPYLLRGCFLLGYTDVDVTTVSGDQLDPHHPSVWDFSCQQDLNIHWAIRSQIHVYGTFFCRVRWRKLSSTTRSFARKTGSWRTAVSASRSKTQTCRPCSKRSRYVCLLKCEWRWWLLSSTHFFVWSDSVILVSGTDFSILDVSFLLFMYLNDILGTLD